MPRIDHDAKRVSIKVVYWGPPNAGKWTNLESIYERTSGGRPAGEKAGAIGFPLELGAIRGYVPVLNLMRSPGEGPLRLQVLHEIGESPPDAVVFVADSSPGALLDNLASLRLLVAELHTRGLDLATLPAVFQYNKRDLPDALAVDQLRAALNPWKLPDGEAIATRQEGVFETVKQISRLVLGALSR
jgi:mutual gliding-motility protein MglA